MIPSITRGVHSKSVEHASLKRPDRDQPRDVFGVDLLERAITMPVVCAAIHQPVRIIATGLQEIVVIDRPHWLGRRGLLVFGGRLEGT